MIICNLAGGLGNQMFQYAFGLSLSMQKSTVLCLDTTEALGNQHNGFELNRVFGITAPVATQADIDNVLGKHWLSKKLLRKSRLVRQKQFHYSPSLSTSAKKLLLRGYWQSEQYFAQHAKEVSAAFTFKALEGTNTTIAKRINECHAISIHIRRGDYLSKEALSTHGVQGISYYEKAIDSLSLTPSKSLLFVIFSDDIPWAKKNIVPLLNGRKCLIVEHNKGENSYRDMQLMSLCRNNIIANSSFSWWAAWLNQHNDKQVVAPKQWFADPSKNTKDLLPDRWIKI